MKSKSPADARTLRQFRASVPSRRKLASMRVLAQRRRLRRQMQQGAENLRIFSDLAAESNPTHRGYR